MLDCPHQFASVRPPRRAADSGFTLIELLVVIGIILVLIGILLPVVSKIRTAANTAATKNFLNQLGSAIDRYQQDFHAYPGPLANNEMDLGDVSLASYPSSPFTTFLPTAPAGSGYDTTSQAAQQVWQHFTMTENLVLGLLGGLHIDSATTSQLDYDPSAVGGGPTSLSIVLPKRYPPYFDTQQLSWQNGSAGKTGHFFDDGAAANDSLIPCFVDNYPNSMPILYLRAKVGANPQLTSTITTYSDAYNTIVTDDLSETSIPGAVRAGQYDISQIIAYTGAYTGTWPNLTRDTASPPTGASIGVGKSISGLHYTTPPVNGNIYHGLQMQSWTGTSHPTLASQIPYDAYPYLVGTGGQVREKDGYILISAGPDRVYGTSDDICNFGTVGN